MTTCNVSDPAEVDLGCGNSTALEAINNGTDLSDPVYAAILAAKPKLLYCPYDPVTRRFGLEDDNCMQVINKVTTGTLIPNFRWAFYTQFNYKLNRTVTVDTG